MCQLVQENHNKQKHPPAFFSGMFPFDFCHRIFTNLSDHAVKDHEGPAKAQLKGTQRKICLGNKVQQ